MKEAQKEARTLRRHVVSLNEQLEAAENEIQAQRKELERAAERMEKDRVRTKEEKEASQKRHAQEVALLKAQSEQTLKEQQARFEEQLEGYRKRLAEEENKRKQEGGDWNKEIAQAIDREQEMRNAVSSLEEEKAVLLSQISTLQGQQTALGSRLESLTQAADNAMEREREAEDRLDSLLNQHARQISQRQVRSVKSARSFNLLNRLFQPFLTGCC
jgi:chromosome segregation ATPase